MIHIKRSDGLACVGNPSVIPVNPSAECNLTRHQVTSCTVSPHHWHLQARLGCAAVGAPVIHFWLSHFRSSKTVMSCCFAYLQIQQQGHPADLIDAYWHFRGARGADGGKQSYCTYVPVDPCSGTKSPALSGWFPDQCWQQRWLVLCSCLGFPSEKQISPQGKQLR